MIRGYPKSKASPVVNSTTVVEKGCRIELRAFAAIDRR